MKAVAQPALSLPGAAAALRYELSLRNQEYARKHALPHCLTYGEMPVVCYEPDEAQRLHGNFLPASYRAILADREWARRLDKAHAQARRSLPRDGRAWRELDSSNSSDALLMNIFCHPRVFADGKLHALLGSQADARPRFGISARVPLANGRADRTEVDMQLGNLLVEAKLTESDFQSCESAVLESYRDFAAVFDRRALPRALDRYCGYQLIRCVLAAQARGQSFTVLCDERRADLREQWYAVLRCVRPHELRVRLKIFTWQEVARASPRPLQRFLDEKYGIISSA